MVGQNFKITTDSRALALLTVKSDLLQTPTQYRRVSDGVATVGEFEITKVRLTLFYWILKKPLTLLLVNFLKANCLTMELKEKQ